MVFESQLAFRTTFLCYLFCIPLAFSKHFSPLLGRENQCNPLWRERWSRSLGTKLWQRARKLINPEVGPGGCAAGLAWSLCVGTEKKAPAKATLHPSATRYVICSSEETTSGTILTHSWIYRVTQSVVIHRYFPRPSCLLPNREVDGCGGICIFQVLDSGIFSAVPPGTWCFWFTILQVKPIQMASVWLFQL